jgi:hypothetical protein
MCVDEGNFRIGKKEHAEERESSIVSSKGEVVKPATAIILPVLLSPI